MAPRAAALLVTVALSAAALSGCGGTSGNHNRRLHPTRPSVADVYVSLPTRSSSAARSVLDGVRLAYDQAHRRAGQFQVVLKVRDSGRAVADGQPPPAAEDASAAASDEHALLFIGGFSDNAAELSVPILNLAGIPELSIGSTYIGLTARLPGITGPDEPQTYYPSGTRTLLRLVPDDSVEAAADLQVLAQERCTSVALAHDATTYGEALAALMARAAPGSGVSIVSSTLLGPGIRTLRAYAADLRAEGAECFEYTGTSVASAVEVTRAVRAVLPTAPILVPDRLCNSHWSSGANAASVTTLVSGPLACTRPLLPLRAYYPAAAPVAATYRAAYGSPPDAWALFGYEAMRLGLDTIDQLGGPGDDRAAVLRALRGMSPRRSVIGTYRFERSGDTNLGSYGLYRLSGVPRPPVFQRVLAPLRVP